MSSAYDFAMTLASLSTSILGGLMLSLMVVALLYVLFGGIYWIVMLLCRRLFIVHLAYHGSQAIHELMQHGSINQVTLLRLCVAYDRLRERRGFPGFVCDQCDSFEEPL